MDVIDNTQMTCNLIENVIFLEVENGLNALQKLAENHRQEIQYPIIGITGSNGKTIVKEWLFQLLSSKMNVARSPKSYNSQIGVPLSLLSLPLNADIGIIEAGISESGEMAKLEKMIQPDIGLLTNIHQAHRENFEDESKLISEKLLLFSGVKKLIYRKDYKL